MQYRILAELGQAQSKLIEVKWVSIPREKSLTIAHLS